MATCITIANGIKTFLLLYFGYVLVSGTTESQYTQTKTFPEKLKCLAEFKNSMLDEVPAKSVSYCSLKCSLYYPECRRFRFDMELKLCTLYPSGENCIALPDRVQHCLCYRLRHICDDVSCSRCPIGYYGNRCEHVVKDCKEWKLQGHTESNGLCFIRPNGVKVFEVECNYKWNILIIQKRESECMVVDFNRSWEDYSSGFGYIHGNFWLGLRDIYDIIHQNPVVNYELHVRMKTAKSKHQCFYINFKVENEANNFTINIAGYVQDKVNTLGNALLKNPYSIDGQPFSTFDRDSSDGCPKNRSGGWWYMKSPDCSLANINGLMDDLRWLNSDGVLTSDYIEVNMRLKRV